MEEEFGKEEEDFDVYGNEGREELTNADEIDDDEEGFMRGYESESDAAFCDNCKKVLERDHVEKDVKGDIFSFCSEECAEEFEKKKQTNS